jgi:hypothetical protein
MLFLGGAFSLISAVRGQAVYWMLPWLAIISYGYVFQIGFLNYYISSGLVLWLLAILWGKRIGWKILLATPVLALALWAHPLPVLWFLGIAVYCRIAQRLKVRFQGLLFILSILILLLIRSYLMHKYYYSWALSQLKYSTGADQALLYGGWGYLIVAAAMLLFSIIVITQKENRWQSLVGIPTQAYFLTAMAIVLMPSGVRSSMQEAWAGFIDQRLSLFSAVLLFAVLGRSVYRKWHLAAGLVAAAIFFSVLYGDVGKAARVEGKMQELVNTLPAGRRVIFYGIELDTHYYRADSLFAKISNLPHMMYFITMRLNTSHLLSRACIGQCYDYMNYEPSSGQFRIHAKPGNPAVVANVADLGLMGEGGYAVKKNDLPMYLVFRCGPEPTDLCLRPLAEGQSSAMLAARGAAAR